MLIYLAIFAAIIAPLVAMAQQPPPAQDPQAQALGKMIMEAAQREASLNMQLIQAQQQLDALKAQAAAKPAEAPKP
jgi:hypothetical protein